MTIPYDPSIASESMGERPVLESGDYLATLSSVTINDKNEYELNWDTYNGAQTVYLRQWLNMKTGFHVHHLKCLAKIVGQEQQFIDRTFNPANCVNRNFKIKVTKKEAKKQPGTYRNWVDAIMESGAATTAPVPPLPPIPSNDEVPF